MAGGCSVARACSLVIEAAFLDGGLAVLAVVIRRSAGSVKISIKPWRRIVWLGMDTLFASHRREDSTKVQHMQGTMEIGLAQKPGDMRKASCNSAEYAWNKSTTRPSYAHE